MIIGGLQKFSLIDYPGHLSAIIFTQGCNFRCHFCYNPMLVWPVGSKLKYSKDHHPIKEDDLFDFLKKRRDKLDAVVITGGEPTLFPDLPELIEKIKKLGYLVKLDTNGTDPEMVERLVSNKLIDYIAMDIKNSPARYEETIGVKVYPVKSDSVGAKQFNGVDFAKIRKSIKMIMEAGLPYEFRTTVVPSLIGGKEIKEIAELIRGAEKWYLQGFKSSGDLVDSGYEGAKAYTDKEMEGLKKIGEKYVKECKTR